MLAHYIYVRESCLHVQCSTFMINMLDVQVNHPQVVACVEQLAMPVEDYSAKMTDWTELTFKIMVRALMGSAKGFRIQKIY